MAKETEAYIVLANQRQYVQIEEGASYQTVGASQPGGDNNVPSGPLSRLSTNSLPAGKSLTMLTLTDTVVVLLPVTGGLAYYINRKSAADVECYFLEPGQVGYLTLRAGTSYTVSNPYEAETIQWTDCWLTTVDVPGEAVLLGTFDLTLGNVLLPLFNETTPTLRHDLFIGRFDGRREVTYRVEKTPDGLPKTVFVLVLSGVFEVANRLLHEQDGLLLCYDEAATVECEALSNNAILLLFDLAS
ncbi:pirin [Fibrella aquatica]|uniref:pirin n=1 Tax=Fibrella aquatica TaxID=3242487 RepID=UPI00352163B0